jgi:hypothetical protein
MPWTRPSGPQYCWFGYALCHCWHRVHDGCRTLVSQVFRQ